MALKYLNNNNEYSSVSRYQVLRVIDNEPNYLETYNQVRIPESTGDHYHIVSKGDSNRLDIIANEYYGDATLWWAIALANDLIDPFSVPQGTVLRIPLTTTLYSSRYGILTRW